MSSVRVVARIRPLLPNELSRDTIVSAVPATSDTFKSQTIKIPNPRNPAENYTFHFNAVYDESSTQQDLFDNEVASTVKHLFNGYDTTIFAYGVTGTGKTHTMKGGKSLAERGVIPRLLSAIYRRGRKTDKDSAGAKKIEVTMSYYEIYCDKVFDLFEPPEKRTPAGLPIRDCNGKTVIAGLTERPCDSLKEFEVMYDEANKNRSVGATKLNAHSSRSHAILCVKVAQIEGDRTVTSTASAIDLAGSEDNRRTENGKERLIESSAINKSLFVLAQCVEAISKKQARIPYRESKMTRILALGQNNGLTLMILNLAPVRSYHLDTLSSLQFANRTKKIEIREVENEPVFRGKQDQTSVVTGPPVHRQPLRALTAVPINIGVKTTSKDKPLKAFSVYSEKVAPNRPSYGRKRPSDENIHTSDRPIKQLRTSGAHSSRSVHPQKNNSDSNITRADLESLVNRMVEEKLAERTIDAAPTQVAPLNIEVQRRLEALEQRVQSQSQDDEKTEGLQYLYMAKQHQARGENASALKMYELAEPFFPGNEKLMSRMRKLRKILENGKTERDDRVQEAPHAQKAYQDENVVEEQKLVTEETSKHQYDDDIYTNDNKVDDDADYTNDTQIMEDEEAYQSDSSFHFKPKKAKSKKIIARPLQIHRDDNESLAPPTPRTITLLRIINTRNISQIKSLKGVGVKKAEGIVNCLLEMGGDEIGDLVGLAAIKGVGVKTVEKMREGIILLGDDYFGASDRGFQGVGDAGVQEPVMGMALSV